MSLTGTNSGGGPPGGKRLRISVKEVARELVADGLDSAGGYKYLRQPTDLVVLGKIQLTPAARSIQVCVCFGVGGRGRAEGGMRVARGRGGNKVPRRRGGEVCREGRGCPWMFDLLANHGGWVGLSGGL